MEGNRYLRWKRSSLHDLENVDEDEVLEEVSSSLSLIPPPQTPKEPMEFLSRSWSLSASEFSKAFAHKQKLFGTERHHNLNQNLVAPQYLCKTLNLANPWRAGSVGKWFQNKEFNNNKVRKKERARIQTAQVHAALSVAGVAAALAAVTATETSNGFKSQMGATAVASAAELLASHCIELAESFGADYDRVASVVRSAVDIRTPSNLMTLTAAAATALRGVAALKARIPKETRSNAVVIPYERAAMGETFASEADVQDYPCKGELLHRTQKGMLHWKQVSFHINKSSQVVVKLKSKHVGGAFSKKKKCVVYSVFDGSAVGRREREEESCYFGLKTAQGLLEFKCKNKISRQRWIEGIQDLLDQVRGVEESERSLESLKFN